MPIEPSLLRTFLEPATLHAPVLDAVAIKSEPEDFVVEELPAYQPCGEGEHLFLWIEKRGLAGPELISRIAKTLRIRAGDIGMAGQKDRHAVTRQYVSVHRECAAQVDRLESDDLHVLSARLHQNKLRTGHLLGNRFRITLRSSGTDNPLTPQDADRVSSQLQQLQTAGFVSSFGAQRFGHEGSTVSDGIELLAGRLSRKRWSFHQQRFMTRLVLSAVQSAVFNLVVHQRTAQRTIQQPLPGDVVIRRHGTRPFLYTGTATSSEAGADPANAAESVVLIPAGPLPGPRMLQAEAGPLEVEQNALRCMGLTGDEFARFAKLASGTRRSMLGFPQNVSVTWLPAGYLQLQFDLAPGTYATTLLREIATTVFDHAGFRSSTDSSSSTEIDAADDTESW